VTTRTIEETLTFAEPFTLRDLDEVFPAGPYTVETEEELIEGLSFIAYRRKITLIHLPAKSGLPDYVRKLEIDPKELEAVKIRDQWKK
jgi:hypothetical protein